MKQDSESEVLQEPSPWPLYQQVKHLILRRINSGHWVPDSKVPSENELVSLLGISRMTINRAIRELTAEGHLYRKRGAGTFVRQKKPQFTLLEIKSIADEIRSRGGVHSCSVIRLEEIKAPGELATAMGLEKNRTLYHSLLVHKDRDLPIQIAQRYVNPDLVPGFIHQDFSQITPSDYLLKTIPVTDIEHIIETCLPDQQTQELLEIPATEPCLELHRTTWLESRVVTKNRFIYPGSRYSLGGKFKTSSFSSQLVH